MLKKGDKVMILNTTLSGKQFEEGLATLIEPRLNDMWLVRFDNETQTHVRWIDPTKQEATS